MARKKYPAGIGSAVQQRFLDSLQTLERECILEIADGLSAHPPAPGSEHYVHLPLTSWESFLELPYFAGLYMIATDYPLQFQDRTHSRLQCNQLPVIYRGHAANVRERVMSHLANRQYREMKTSKNLGFWTQCLKLSTDKGTGGIDFREAPFADFRWEVMVMPLRGSNERFRELAEWAYDQAFGKPICCNERTTAPAGLPSHLGSTLADAQPA